MSRFETISQYPQHPQKNPPVPWVSLRSNCCDCWGLFCNIEASGVQHLNYYYFRAGERVVYCNVECDLRLIIKSFRLIETDGVWIDSEVDRRGMTADWSRFSLMDWKCWERYVNVADAPPISGTLEILTISQVIWKRIDAVKFDVNWQVKICLISWRTGLAPDLPGCHLPVKYHLEQTIQAICSRIRMCVHQDRPV